MEWKQLEIPGFLVGEKRTSQSTYVTTYQTEILLPKNSEYEGYCFLHPSKLVGSSLTIAKISYNDSFVFKLFKKDREPGKRYKRYTLTALELIKIYEKDTEELKAKLAKKEQKRLAEIGSVEAVLYESNLWGNKVIFLFHKGKQYYYSNGNPYGSEKNVKNSKVIASNVLRSSFEAAHEQIQSLCDEYRIVYDVHNLIEKSNSRSHKGHEIEDSFADLCAKWEKDCFDKVRTLLATPHSTSST